MFKLIAQLLLAFLVFRLIGSLTNGLRGGSRKKAAVDEDRQPQSDPADGQRYDELTPYEIEDAQYEELPKQN